MSPKGNADGLETLCAEETKERMGSRTGFGQNLGRGEFGRFAEKPRSVFI
jgi:hypothetical protein